MLSCTKENLAAEEKYCYNYEETLQKGKFSMNNSDDFDDELIHQIYVTTRLFSKTLNNDIYKSGIYSSEWSVLNAVKRHNGIAQLDLIADIEAAPAAISKTLAKLEQKGIITRSSLENRRGKFITLTEKGLALFAELEQKVIAHRRMALANIPAEKKEIILKLMQQISQNLEN